MEHISDHASNFDAIRIRSVESRRPLRWLAAGWRDLQAASLSSLAYGIVFALFGYAIFMFAWYRPYLFTAMVSGFFLVGPFLAIGLYQISRRLEREERASFADSILAWRENPQSIGLFGFLLAFILISWERLSAVLFALFFHGGDLPSLEALANRLFSVEYLGFVAAYLLFGALLAGVVFAISAVSIPLMLDRKVDTATAVVTSVRVCARNAPAMALWAALIVALVGVGLLTLFIGLIVTLPLVGHATWHAYKDLVETD